MSLTQFSGKNVDVHAWIPEDQLEQGTRTQLTNIASLPWVHHHVAAMADSHVGIGCTVGSVIAMRGAVAPAAVGVDIGCGMAAVKTNLKASDLPDNLSAIRSKIEELIPVGFNAHPGDPTAALDDLNPLAGYRLDQAISEHLLHFPGLEPGVQDLYAKSILQLGTLGGGNHFIELCLDSGKCTSCDGSGWLHITKEDAPDSEAPYDIKCGCFHNPPQQNVWLMLHSGSRNIGKSLAEIHMARAKKLAHNAELPDPDLAVFLAGTEEMQAYRRDLYWAQEYAALNRRVMMALYEAALRSFFPQLKLSPPVACHHNYVAEEHHFGEDVFVTRKGAIEARQGQLGIIPGSMGAKSFIVRGLGNPESFLSASHGAGRKMSRGQARRKFTKEDLAAQTAGVECRKDAGVVDEIPAAYKNIEDVMKWQSDLVEVVAELKQVLCVKG